MFSITNKNGLCLIICTFFIPILSRKIAEEMEYRNILTNTLAEIVNSCHINNKSSILVSENFNPMAIQQILLNPKPIIMSNNFKLQNNEIKNTVRFLIISTPSVAYLRQSLRNVKKTVLSGQRQKNIIFNINKFPHNCFNYSSYLHIAWKRDLLDTIYVCIDPKKRVRILTFNPYTNWAPQPWASAEMHINHEHDFHTYIIKYKPGLMKCKDLFFDKTRRLNGYKGVRAVTYIPTKKNHLNMAYDINFNVKKVFDIRMAKLLFNKLRIPFKYERNTQYGTFSEKGIPTGVDSELSQDNYDILLDYRALSYTRNLVHSSSIVGESGVSFISHYEGTVSTLTQLLHYFKPIIIFFSVVVLGLTIAVLKLSMNENFDSAIIEVFRLFFNGPLLRVPDRVSPRIYIFTILIYILVMQTILRSKILSFIMAPDSNDLEKFSDLEEHEDYKLYCRRGYSYIMPTTLQHRCINVETFAKLYNQTKVALVYDYYFNIGLAKKQNMHHSKEMISKFHISYRMRKTWPLIRRVDTIYTRIFESGISGINLKWAKIDVFRLFKFRSNKKSKRRALHLLDLKFAFQTLMCGMITAFIMFLIEIRFWKIIACYLNLIIRRPNHG